MWQLRYVGDNFHCAILSSFLLYAGLLFSCTDHVTDSERFYNSILELLEDLEERDEVDQLMAWWNRYVVYYLWESMLMNICRQVFPLYTEVEQLPSQNSVLARIRQKCVEHRERGQSVEI